MARLNSTYASAIASYALMTMSFTTIPTGDYAAITTRCGLLDHSQRGKLALSGAVQSRKEPERRGQQRHRRARPRPLHQKRQHARAEEDEQILRLRPGGDERG